MYTLFSKVRKSVFSKALGVFVIVAVMFPASAVAPLAFAEGEETAAPMVEVLPAAESAVSETTEVVQETVEVPLQTVDAPLSIEAALADENTKEETDEDKVSPKSGGLISDVVDLVKDIFSSSREEGASEQVTFCHVPPGNPAAAQTLTTSYNAYQNGHGNHSGDYMGECQPVSTATVQATKIVCDSEDMLPNWGDNGADITSTTATDFVQNHKGCSLKEGWNFQWSLDGVSAADNNADDAGTGWNAFSSSTDSNGVATAQVPSGGKIWFREQMKPGYVPFSGDTSNDPYNTESAEFYCSTDVLHYDNWEYIDPVAPQTTYYCVAFNALNEKDKTSTITVNKVLDSNYKGPLTVNDFKLYVDGYTMQNGVADSFDPGSFYVHEAYVPGFVPTFSGSCTANSKNDERMAQIQDYEAKMHALQKAIDANPNDPGNAAKEDLIEDFMAKASAIYETIDANVYLGEGQHLTCTITNTFVPEEEVAPYCGDGIVNQGWEMCDGGEGCSQQCQSTSQCTNKAFARVVVNNTSNTGTGNVTSDIYLGGSNPAVNKIPSGTWFMIYDGVNYVTDPALTTGSYMDVPGLAVERTTGNIYTALWGDHNDHSKEHVDGYVEFFNVVPASVTQSNNSLPPRLELPFNGTGFGGTNNSNDELRIVTPGKSEFSMTTTTNGDSFHTEYESLENSCTLLTVVKTVTNDGNGTKTSADFTMNVTGTAVGTPESFPGSALGTTIAVDPGTYSVYESAAFGGYDGTLDASCTGTIAAGEHKTCTVANNDTHYSAYCGDNILNQAWEQCDGTAGCSAQCQMGDQCTEMAFARVQTDNMIDTSPVNDLTTDVYVGGTNGDAMILPNGTWFMIHNGTTALYDNRTNGSDFFNVPGIAVQRIKDGAQRVLVGVFGQDIANPTTVKHVDGKVEFFNTTGTSVINGPGSMGLENGFDNTGFGGTVHTNDEVRLIAGAGEFSLSTASQGDAFATTYSTPKSCDEGGTDGQGGTTGDDGDGTTGGTATSGGTGTGTGTTTSGTTTGSTGGGSSGGSGSGGSGGSGGGGTGGAVLLPPTGSVLGDKTADLGGGGDGDAQGQVLGESLAQTGISLSFPMIFSIILAITTIIVTRKEKFV